MIDTQAIRAKILDLAMRGHLTTQSKTETVALDSEILTDTPHSIPSNWKWVRIEQVITKDVGGGTPSKSVNEYWENGTIPWMSVKDFSSAKNGVLEDTIDHITQEGLENSSANLVDVDAIIICMRMALGKIVKIRKPMAINQDLRAIWLDQCVDKDFFVYYYSTLKVEGHGMTVAGINKKQLMAYLMPLPPLSEQQRIVTRIQQGFSFLNTIETLQEQYANNRTALKSKLIDSAIQGLLTDQLQQDGTAEELYQKIQAEKQTLSNPGKSKKEKNLLEISADDIPFSIPENWKWVRLGDLLSIQPSNGFSPKGVNYQTAYRNLTLTATSSGFFKPEAFKYVDISEAVAEKYYLKNQDILIQRSNSRELVGTSCIYHLEDDQYIYPDLMMRMHVVDGLNTSFIDLVLKSPYCRSYYQNAASGTSDSMPKVNQATVRNTLIPLPPINEQNRIIAKLEELLLMFE